MTFLRKLPLPRSRKTIAITAGAAILLLPIAAFFFLRTSNYVPCITLEDFTGGSRIGGRATGRICSQENSFPVSRMSPSWIARNSNIF